jgi:O-methyltransferase
MGNRKDIGYNMKARLKRFILKRLKVDQNTAKIDSNLHSDFTAFDNDVINKTSNYTMTSPERIVSVIRAVDYIIENKIEGAIVECGVWKGGCIMAALLALQKTKTLRDVYLYDTFEGMTEPQDVDLSFSGSPAKDIYQDKAGVWCYSSLDEVRANINTLNYPKDNIQYIQGKVEDTIPNDDTPKDIALLRLDTDWYESTKHEMEQLFPRLVKGGVIIIDDYGHWKGCKKAVDEYLEKNNITLFLSRVDYTCRVGVKM